MSEQGDFELFSGPTPSEKKEGSDEKFQEEMKKTQKAIKQLQKEEGQAKGHDSNLAAIIVQFLADPTNTDLFLLISRVVAQNIPSELIIAILSLIDKNAHKEVKGLLETSKDSESSHEMALAIHQKDDFKTLPPAQKKAIDNWILDLSKIAGKKPHRILETLIIPTPQRQLSPMPIQLSTFILRKYLAQHQIDLEFETLRDFMQGVFVELVKKLEGLLEGQKKLSH
ncbi:hypothetical protein KAR91_24820 [Candidatus Pacearchaeota archaeon]|nr:hypothetical protein [Candidatus Pacearchaeota archaeon]